MSGEGLGQTGEAQFSGKEALREPAQRYETFRQRAERETDPKFKSDLEFAAGIAEWVQQLGGQVLAVGGYARDEVIRRELGQEVESKDIDLEIYGIDFALLHDHMEMNFGRVDEAGASFVVAKVKNPGSGQQIDVSIPRADSKTGTGHTDFEVTGNPDMDPEDAARRRDLTMNALAIDPLTGELVDFYNGVQDIRDKTMRATDPEHFGEDALRALRVMQFAGRFEMGVDDRLAELCRQQDLSELPGERIGEEWRKLLCKSEHPSVGIRLAKELGILAQLHPELDHLAEVSQEADWHPEGNVFVHTVLAADAAARICRELKLEGDEAFTIMLAALCHDLGKGEEGVTKPTNVAKEGEPENIRLTARGHELQLAPTEAFLARLNVKNEVTEKVLKLVRWHMYPLHTPEYGKSALNTLAKNLQPATIEELDLVSRADSNGRDPSGHLVPENWIPQTASAKVLEAAREWGVGKKPVERAVQGGDLMEALGLRGRDVSIVVHWLYSKQMDREFGDEDKAGAIRYAREHEAEIREVIMTEGRRREAELSRTKAENAALTAWIRTQPAGVREQMGRDSTFDRQLKEEFRARWREENPETTSENE